MHWIPLTDVVQLSDIYSRSFLKPVVIFKHSNRCSLSGLVLARLERETPIHDADWYLLDLISYRALSGKIAETYAVYHESPQILLIRNGECTYTESHYAISMTEIMQQIN